MVDEGPTEDGARQGQGLSEGRLCAELRHLDENRLMLLQIQLDDLGIDYINRRNGLIDAVTIEDATPRGEAAGRGRHADHGGRPAEGPRLEGTRAADQCAVDPVDAACPTTFQIFRWPSSNRSIAGDAGELRRRAVDRTGEALDWLRARHADGKLPLLRLAREARRHRHHPRLRRLLRERHHRRGLPRHRRLEPRRPDAGAARRLCRAGRRRACAIRRASISWTISIPTATATLLQRLPLADQPLRRGVEIRRHRRDADADHRRARRGKAAKLDPHARIVLGITEPAKPGKPNGLRACSARTRSR